MNPRRPEGPRFDLQAIAEARMQGEPNLEAESQIYEYLRPRVMRTLLRLYPSQQPRIEDAVDESMVSIISGGLGRIQDPSRLLPYFITIGKRALNPRGDLRTVSIEEVPSLLNLSSEPGSAHQEYQLPEPLRPAFSFMPALEPAQVRIFGVVADILAERPYKEPNRLIRGKQDMLILMGAFAGYTNRQIARYVEGNTNRPLGEEGVNTRRRRAMKLLDDKLFNPLGFVSLSLFSDEAGRPIIREASVREVNFFSRPYASVADIGEAVERGELPESYGQKARQEVADKKMPPGVEASLKSDQVNLNSLIMLLGKRGAISLEVSASETASINRVNNKDSSELERLSDSDRVVAVLRWIAPFILKSIHAPVADLVLQGRHYTQIAEDLSMSQATVLKHIMETRRVLESKILYPAGFIKLKHIDDEGIKEAGRRGRLQSFQIGKVYYTHNEWGGEYKSKRKELDPDLMEQNLVPIREYVRQLGGDKRDYVYVYNKLMRSAECRGVVSAHKKRIYIPLEQRHFIDDIMKRRLNQ